MWPENPTNREPNRNTGSSVKDARLHCGLKPAKGLGAMHEDQENGQRKDPLALERKSVIDAAASQFCPACGGQPCYLLTSTAIAVFYEVFTHNEDHISIDRYERALAGIHDCLMRHYELIEEIRTDNHYPKEPKGSNDLRNNGMSKSEGQRQDLHNEAGTLRA
jgi:hypothetical protein